MGDVSDNAMQIEYILGKINAYGDNIHGLPFRTNDLVWKLNHGSFRR